MARRVLVDDCMRARPLVLVWMAGLWVGCDEASSEPPRHVAGGSQAGSATAPPFHGTPTAIEVDDRTNRKIPLLVDLPDGFELQTTLKAAFVNKSMTASIMIDEVFIDDVQEEALPYDQALVAAGDVKTWIHREKQAQGYELGWFGPSQRMPWETEADRRNVYQYYVVQQHRGEPVECRGETSTRALLDTMLAVCRTVRVR